MTSVFTNTFGGSAVSPADVAYASYSFAENLTLYWPQFSAGQTNVAARFMNLTATNTSLEAFMPDATLTSVGQDVIIFNEGSDTFDVVDFDGGAIATIAPGQTYYIILNDNTSQAGGWQTVQFGVGTGSADAAALAGAGLLASSGMLNVNFNATTASGDYTITSAARAILQVWTGGSGTIALPNASSVGDGFFFPFSNDGSGSVTLAPSGGDLIDGGANSIFGQTQSAFIISSGGAWYTVGKGTQTNFAVTILNLNVAGSSDVTETSAQAQNIIQQFTGILTANINVIVPATVQLYYPFNNTSGSYTLTMKTPSGTGVTIDQGSHVIVYCDGTNIVNAFTSSFGGAISIGAGSATAPNLNFVGSVTTGLYSPTTDQLAITAGGKEVMNFISDASAVNWLEAEATATGDAPVISAKGSDTNIGIILSPKGSGAIGIPKAIILGGSIDSTIIGGSTPAAITGTTITGSSLVGPVTGNASTATALQTPRNINGVSFNGTADITVAAAAGTLTGTTLAANVVSSSLTSVGTLATGIWQANVIAGQYGGTGIANTGKTITLGGNLVTSGANSTTLTTTGSTNVILPTTGTLATLAGTEALTNKSVNGVTLTTAGSGLNYLNDQGNYSIPAPTVVFSAINGFIPSSFSGNNTTAALSVSSGQASDSSNSLYITKGTSTTWTVANGNAINGFQSGTTLPNSATINFYICAGTSGTGVFACNQSVSLVLPSGYNNYVRRIFSLNTNSAGALIPGTAVEVEGGALQFYFTTPLLDISTATLGNASRTLYTLTVPQGIIVQPSYRASSNSAAAIIITSGAEPDILPTRQSGSVYFTTTPGYDLFYQNNANVVASIPSFGNHRLITNTSGQIGARAESGTTNILNFVTIGYEDFRRS